MDSLNVADSSKQLITNVIKSLYTSTGLIKVNPASLLKAPKVREQLAQRILSQEDVIRTIALETTPARLMEQLIT